MLLPLGAKALLQTDSGGGLISVSVSFLVHLFSQYIAKVVEKDQEQNNIS